MVIMVILDISLRAELGKDLTRAAFLDPFLGAKPAGAQPYDYSKSRVVVKIMVPLYVP